MEKHNNIRLTEAQLNAVINESINKVLSEAFNSKKLDRYNREHGGIKYPYQASTLSDDEIGEPTKVRPNNVSDYYEMKDGSYVPLKLNNDHRKIWQRGDDEIDRRWREHNGTTPDAYQKKYSWSNDDAEQIFNSRRENENGKFATHPSFKDSTPSELLFDRHGDSVGDPKLQWRQMFYDDGKGEGGVVNYNIDPMSRAKEKYHMSRNKMNNKEKAEYLSSKYPNRTKGYTWKK